MRHDLHCKSPTYIQSTNIGQRMAVLLQGATHTMPAGSLQEACILPQLFLAS